MLLYLKANLTLILLVLGMLGSQPEQIKILIIGDSISIGYTPFVQETLKDIAQVSHNPGNAQHTGTGLANIESWIGDEEWDIIQINWGLWDLCYRHPDSKEEGKRDKANGTVTFSQDDYRDNLDSLVRLIRKKSEAKLVFVTTSYVPQGEPGRNVKDAIKYNRIAKKVMKSHNITINDIYKKSIDIHHDSAIAANDVHYTKKGYEALGTEISDFLKTVIELRINSK